MIYLYNNKYIQYLLLYFFYKYTLILLLLLLLKLIIIIYHYLLDELSSKELRSFIKWYFMCY